MRWFRRFQSSIDFPVFKSVGKIKVAVFWLRDLTYLLFPDETEWQTIRYFDAVFSGFQPTIFLDIGANVGDYSWRVCNTSSRAEIWMFEPDTRNAELIIRTLEKNDLKQVTLHSVAVSDRSGTLEFFVDEVSGTAGSIQDHSTNSGSLHVAYQMSKKRVVPCVELDSFIERLRGQPIMIKIDVEGAENSVLNGARLVLREVRPIFLIECFDLPTITWMVDDGYVIRDLREKGNYLVFPGEMKEKVTGWVRDLE